MRTKVCDAIFCLLVVGALIWSCSKSTIIDMVDEPAPESYTPRRVKVDTTAESDSVPITFTVTVEGWKEITINE